MGDVVVLAVRVRTRTIIFWITLQALLTVAIIWGTSYFLQFYYETALPYAEWPLSAKYAFLLNLTVENNIAAWYSSMLLWGVSLTLILGWLGGGRAGRLGMGWLLAGTAFAALSLDELGSFHERLLVLFNQRAWFFILLPLLALMLGYMVAFGAQYLRASRGGFLLLLAGSLLFASIPVQEVIETTLYAQSDARGWQRPIASIIAEEGAELAGAICFLAATMLFLRVVLEGKNGPVVAELSFNPSALRVGVFAWLFAGTALMAVLSGVQTGNDRAGVDGMPQNWFPAASGLVMALLFFSFERRAASLGAKLSLLGAGIMCLWMSIYAGANLENYFFISEVDKARIPIIFAFGSVGLGLLHTLPGGQAKLLSLAGIVALIIAQMCSSLGVPAYFIHVGVCLLALGVIDGLRAGQRTSQWEGFGA